MSVLFADLVGFTARSDSLDPEDVEAILRPFYDRLRTELEVRGGTVEKFIGDAVMAVFGAPIAHEDDPERAVRAALAIRDWVREEEELEVRIAVNTGEVLVALEPSGRAWTGRGRRRQHRLAAAERRAGQRDPRRGDHLQRHLPRHRVPRGAAGRRQGQGGAGAGLGSG